MSCKQYHGRVCGWISTVCLHEQMLNNLTAWRHWTAQWVLLCWAEMSLLFWDVLVVVFASMRNSGSPMLFQQCCLWPSLSCQCLKCPFSVRCRNNVAVPDWDISATLLRERYFGSAVWAHVHVDSNVKQGLGKQKHQSRPNIGFFHPLCGVSNHHGRKAPRGNKYCFWSMAEWPHYWPNSWVTTPVAKLHCIWCLGSGLWNEQSLRCMRWNWFQSTEQLETTVSEWGRAEDWHAGVRCCLNPAPGTIHNLPHASGSLYWQCWQGVTLKYWCCDRWPFIWWFGRKNLRKSVLVSSLAVLTCRSFSEQLHGSQWTMNTVTRNL